MRCTHGLCLVALLVACPGSGDEGPDTTPGTGTGTDPSGATASVPTDNAPTATDPATDPATEPTPTATDPGPTTSDATSVATGDTTDPTNTGTDDTGPINGDSHPIDPLPAPLIVWIDPGPDGTDPYLPFTKPLGDLQSAPLQGTSLAELQERGAQAQTAYNYAHDYSRCIDEQGDTETCVKKIVWQGLCNWAVGKLTEHMSPGMQMIGFPFEAVCNGEPALKCCIYTGNDSCHSAYNSDMPINCEGNPMGGMSYGPCISDNPEDIFEGCTCDYIPECTGGDAPVGDPKARAGRLDQGARELGKHVAALAAADPRGFLNFVSLQGTRDYTAALALLAPYAGPDEIPPNLVNYEAYHYNDDDPRSRYLRALTTVAVRRVIGGLPNSLDRWDHVLAKIWDDAGKTAYLADVADPEADLLAALGPFGLAMTKAAYPDTYLLLAAPTPTEVADPDAGLYLAGVEIAAPPVLSFQTASVDGPAVTLELAIDDPQALDNPDATYLVGVDWGDNVFEGLAVTADPATHQVQHAYAAAGSYSVRAWTDNTAGLISGAGATIAVTSGTDQPHPRSIESVTLELRADVTADQHGHFSVSATGLDAGAYTHPLGRAWVAATGPANTPVMLDFPDYALTHGDRVALPSVRVHAIHEGATNVQSATVLLDGITVTYYTSEDQAPLTITHAAADLTAVIEGDPPTPLMPTNGALALPLATDVKIDLPPR